MPEDAKCEMMKGNIALDGGKQTGMGHCISERHSAVDDFFSWSCDCNPTQLRLLFVF